MQLKPQDILVLLKLVACDNAGVSFNQLAVDLEMSPSEVHQAVQRAVKAKLLHVEKKAKGGHSKVVHRAGLFELLVHGVKYVLPPELGGETRGFVTGYAAPPLATNFSTSGGLPPVWPHAEGNVRGLAFEPIYRSAPAAARRDPRLYELLVLVDAIRGGRARERVLAEQELKKRLLDDRKSA